MILRGIDFGKVFLASGTLNFFGEGWPYHKYYRHIPGFGFEGATFVSKTTVLPPKPGNMPLDENLQPKEFKPECIYVDFRKCIALNAVALSGPGAKALLNTGKWQRRNKPFVISYMPICGTKDERLGETEEFAELFLSHLPDFAAPVALEVNISCPNVKHDLRALAEEAIELLKIVSKLSIPIIVKLNALTDVLVAKEIAESGSCDAFDVSNTIPFGQLPDQISWASLFGDYSRKHHVFPVIKSPLEKFGGGGLSGKPLLPIVARWIKDARRLGIGLPIIGGGGITSKDDLVRLKIAGADAVSIGTVTMLRPWRVQSIINHGNKSIGGK